MGVLPNFRMPGAERDEFVDLDVEFESLRAGDAKRLTRYRQYREEMEVGRDDLPASLDPTLDYGQRTVGGLTPERHSIPLPFGQAITVKHAYSVSGRMPEVIVDRREESAVERYRSDVMEKMIWGVFRESKGEAQFASGAWDASQIGAACLEVYYSIGKNLPCIRSIDPAGVLVRRGVDDPHEFQRLYRFWDVPAESVRNDYRGKDFRGEPVEVDKIKGDGDGMVTLIQVSEPNRTLRFVGGENPVPLWERVHNYGFVNYIVIPNLGPDRAVWGWADYEFVRGIAAYLPKLFSREADILRSVAGGAYMDKRSGQDAAKIQKIIAEGGVLPTKRDGNVEPISAPEVPAMATEHADRALVYLKMLGFAPDAAWGDGNAGSGSDRGLQMQPKVELTALKQINWCSGLARLGSMIFRMIEAKQAGKARYRGVAQRGYRKEPFNLTLDANAQPKQVENPGYDALDPSSEPDVLLPQSPKDIFDGDYEVRFSWQNRTDPDDPAYVMSELNKFQQGAQSLRTTLEHLGCDNPEDEIKLIEQEANDHPWLRQGMIALIKSQLDSSSQGEGGGPPVDPGTGLDDAISQMTSKDGQSEDASAGATGLGGSGINSLYGS